MTVEEVILKDAIICIMENNQCYYTSEELSDLIGINCDDIDRALNDLYENDRLIKRTCKHGERVCYNIS